MFPAGQHGPGHASQFVGDRDYDFVARGTLSHPMHPLSESSGIVLDAKQYRASTVDHLRPAAVKAGILSSHRDSRGRLVDDDPRRFGFHNLRHSLASFLIRTRTDPKTVQTLLRHSDVKLTLQFYTHAVSRDRMAAAGKMLTAILSHAADQSGLKADYGRIAPA